MSTPPSAPPVRDLRPLLVDVAAVVSCVAVMTTDMVLSHKTEATAAGFASIVAGALPIMQSRRAPIGAFALAMALIFGILSFAGIYATVACPAMLCAYVLAGARGRRVAAFAALAAMPTVLLMLDLYSPYPLLGWDTAKNLSFVCLPLALGVASHDRRAHTAALVERAEAAERSREEEALRRVGEERLRIAQDVHDVVAHAMVAINVQAGVGAHLADRDPGRARGTLRDIKRVSGEALGELRSVLGLLREDSDSCDPSARTRPTRLMSGVEELRESLGAAGVELEIRLDEGIEALPAAVGATGYRIVQEALTNVMRHVGPTSAQVRATLRAGVLEIEVDNDRGLGPTALTTTGSGNGLRGMRERAAAVGGSLTAGPREQGGWRVAASLPVGRP
ncbi:two-component sensor histidine kinase [Streptomyces sp. P38-E01]|uniref:histidine kinase n=1 Tax=Streptomyces tardus TaxID=2780544 RepID=A0A949N6D1_9ACTN|nr:histidine kinase [Streptomyces tardus]MBU7596271.1 two-component sensor histidine kinase [Streptomyces tardus]